MKKRISEKSEFISVMKLFLLLGVVLSHCNPGSSPASQGADSTAMAITEYITRMLNVCPSCFFIISSYLFFKNIKGRFNAHIYCNKLRRRVRTLLVPYLAWNTICAALLIVKAGYLGFPGGGIVSDGNVDWLRLLEGFWMVEGNKPYPLAFAFWFIRNLMVFILLSPAVWLIARNRWSTCIFFIVYIVTDFNFHGLQWFVLGSSLALCGLELPQTDSRRGILFTAAALLSGCFLNIPMHEPAARALLLVFTISVWFALSAPARAIATHPSRKTFKILLQASFFIYAFHQCFCTLTVTACLRLFGTHTFAEVMAAYLMSFVALTGISTVVYLFIKRTLPAMTGILTGGR